MKAVVFTFGRMNPPTLGHERLISKVVETTRTLGADHVVYLSQTSGTKTDPLEWSFKRRVCESAFRGVYISNNMDIKNPFIALEHLKEHYNKLILVTGSDQHNDYSKFEKYTKDWGVEFEVISAGERLSEGAGIEGMSASTARKFAMNGDKEQFMECLPSGLSVSIKELVYRNTRKGIKESENTGKIR